MTALPTPAAPAAISLAPLDAARRDLAAWADATYGPGGWRSVAIVTEKPGGGSPDVLSVTSR